MGAWSYIAPRLTPQLPDGVGAALCRTSGAGQPGGGLCRTHHAAEQARIIGEALGGERPARMETREGQYAD